MSYLDEFSERALQEALASALAVWWNHRADQLDAARPRPGDYPGAASTDEIAAIDRRLAEAATACRNRAKFGLQPGDAAAVALVLAEAVGADA